MSPLETLLRPVARLLNRNIEESTPARELCRRLAGKVVAIRVRDTALVMYVVIGDESLALATEPDAEPDIVITGTPLTLARMTGRAGATAIRDGLLDVTGDVDAAQDFHRLLALAKPDIEEELSHVVGDAAANRLGEIARGVRRWDRETRSTMRGNIREYLQEESRDLPTRYEVERFARDVDTLRDDVERLAARMDRLLARTR